MKPPDVQLDLQGRRGEGLCGGLGNKRILLCHQRGSAPTHLLLCGDSFLFFWEWLLEGGWDRAPEFDGRDADFKVIFNFKPCSHCEMKPAAPDTVLPMAPSGSLPPLPFFFFFQAFVMVAFKWHYSPTGWPNEGVPLTDLKEMDFNSWDQCRRLKQHQVEINACCVIRIQQIPQPNGDIFMNHNPNSVKRMFLRRCMWKGCEGFAA